MSPHRCAGCGVPIPPSRGGSPRKWCSDQCRKRTLYGGTCVDCGAPTNGSDGLNAAPSRCRSCAGHARAYWTREAVIGAIQAFAGAHGRPPSATDWNPSQAVAQGRLDRAERFYAANGAWPSTWTVQGVFGSWTAAIHAAGYETNPGGTPGRAVAA